MKLNQVKSGVILSYLLIVLNTVYGLVITPYMIGCLGEAEYGVYKTIASLTTSLMVLDLGIGSTVMRYVAKYKATGQENKIANYVAMNIIQAAVLCGVIILVAAGAFTTIRPAYSSTFTEPQIQKAQKLFVGLIVNILLHVFENVINGVITGYNRFFFGNGIKVLRLLLRMLLIFLVLKVYTNAMALVFIDFLLTSVFLVVEVIYMQVFLKVRIKLTKWEKAVFLESGVYTTFMFLTSIAAQVNSNLDNVVIGAIRGPGLVTIYSMALLIFGMFENLSTAVSGVMLPTVTNILEKDDSKSQIERLVVRVGRIQFMLMGAALVGFVCLGKSFIHLWLGEGFEDVYIITLILIVPALFELCVNTCLSILRAKNKIGFRTAVLFCATILNAGITYFTVRYWSYIGAAFGTSASFLVGSIIIMNLYFVKKLGLPMLRIYGQIFSRTWLCLLLAGGVLWGFTKCFYSTIWAFLAGIVVFVVVYGAGMLLYGFSAEERQFLKIGRKKNG